MYDPKVTGDLTFTVILSRHNYPIDTQLGAPSNTLVVVQDADAGLSFTNPPASVLKNAGSVVIAVVCSNTDVEPVLVNSNSVPCPCNIPPPTARPRPGWITGRPAARWCSPTASATNYFTCRSSTTVWSTGDRTFTSACPIRRAPGQVVPPSTQTVTIIDNNSGLSFSSPTYTVLKTDVAAKSTFCAPTTPTTMSSVNFATNGTAVAGLDYWRPMARSFSPMVKPARPSPLWCITHDCAAG